jgi:hypothetical protein
MASVTVDLIERRRDRRRPLHHTGWDPRAVLRPGVPVVVLNISARAALVESELRLRPGALTEMQLMSKEGRVSVRGRLERCFVSAIAPLRYRGVLIFEHVLDLDAGAAWERE